MPKFKLSNLFSRKKKSEEKYMFSEMNPEETFSILENILKIKDNRAFLKSLCDSAEAEEVLKKEKAAENLTFLKSYKKFLDDPSQTNWDSLKKIITDPAINLSGVDRKTLSQVTDPKIFFEGDSALNKNKQALNKAVKEITEMVTETIKHHITTVRDNRRFGFTK